MPALFCLCMDLVLVELGVEPLQSLGEYRTSIIKNAERIDDPIVPRNF